MRVGSKTIYFIGIIKVQITSILNRLHNTVTTEVTHFLQSLERSENRDIFVVLFVLELLLLLLTISLQFGKLQ